MHRVNKASLVKKLISRLNSNKLFSPVDVMITRCNGVSNGTIEEINFGQGRK